MAKQRSGRMQSCQNCNREYYIPPSRFETSKFCCRSCNAEAQTTLERREIVCRRCGKKFIATQDHGKWPVFCSRDCFESEAPKPKEKKCPGCGNFFLATRSTHSPDGLRTNCSRKCYSEKKRKDRERICPNCGKLFYARSSLLQQSGNNCCSEKCQYDYFVMDKRPQWKGGKYIDTGSGQRKILFPRENFSSKYLAEHRIIAAQCIGRFLMREEMMLHLNDEPDDNRPENLFICGSISEMRRRRNGTLPWPSESNLSTYR